MGMEARHDLAELEAVAIGKRSGDIGVGDSVGRTNMWQPR